MSGLWLILAAGLLCAASVAAAEGEWTVRAGTIARSIGIRDGRLSTTALRAGRVMIPAAGPEFRLCIGEQPRVLSSDDYRARSVGAGGFRCDGPPDSPTVVLAYAAADKLGVVRKVARVTNNTGAPILLRWMETESLKPGEPITYAVSPAFPQLGDWGQPVYTRHLFMGIEFPAARCTALPDGSLQMREYPGVWLKPGESWTSHPVVLGGSPSGEAERAFMDYVAGLSPHAPHAPRPFIYWNGFRVIMPPDRTPQGLRMVEEARELKRLTGFTFDSWTYDAGFDMYRADGLWIPNEPDVWPKTREALKAVGTPLGFWTSFSCIFDTPSHAWGKTQGFGLQHPAAYCLAEPKYAHAMEDRLVDIVRTYGMRSINFDGMYWGQGFGCNTPGHGHLVGEGAEAGIYGTYAVVANQMRIFRRLREVKPEICLDLFICNEWSSPWWLTVLDGVHTVPGDTVAAGIPSPWLRDELITVRDMQVWEEHKHLKRQFPLWAEDLYGNQVRADHLIDGIEVTGEDMAARWEDELVMALVARGAVENHIVCCDLHVLAKSKSGLKFLGEVGNWVRANASVYRHWTLLGGEPAKQEPFGYAHGDGHGRAVVGLRNPSIRTQTFPLRITKAFNVGEPGPYQVTMVYPYRYTWNDVPGNRSLPITLPDFQVAILEVRSASRRIPGMPEGRWREESGHIASAGPDSEPAVPRVSLSVPDSGKPEIAGSVTIPAGQRAELQVSVSLPSGAESLKAGLLVDGRACPAAVHFRERESTQDAWVLAAIPPGEHQVRLTLDCPLPARLEAWLQYRVVRGFRRTNHPAPAGLLPAMDAAELRRTIAALAPTYAASMEPLPQGTVWLGDLRGRCVRAETGWGQVGWNQSCWKEQPQIRLGSKTYSRGLGVHAPGRFDFLLDGRTCTLKAEVGLHPIPPDRRPEGWPRGSARFRVEADGKVIYRSRVLRETDGPLPISVPLKGVRMLSLIVEDGGDGIFDDLTAWADARLEQLGSGGAGEQRR